MKMYVKKFLYRGLFGILIGLSIGYTVLALITLRQQDMTITGEIIAFNYLMGMFVGFYMAGISVIYEVEEWSLLRQTITHALLLLPYIPVAFVIGWAPEGLIGRIIFVAFYFVVYAIVWFSFKAYWIKRARELNEELAKLDNFND